MISIKLILLLTSITFHDACIETFQSWPEQRISRKAWKCLEQELMLGVDGWVAYYLGTESELRDDADEYYIYVLDWWDYPEDLKEVQRVSKYYYTIYGWLSPDGVPYRPRQVRKFAWSQYGHSLGVAIDRIIVREVLQDTIFETPEPMLYQSRDQG